MRSAPIKGASFNGAKLRSLREKAKLDRFELAIKSGVRPGTITNLELGIVQDPQSSTLKALARALGVTMEALLQ